MPPVGKHPDQRHGHRTTAENSHDEVPPRAVNWPEPSESWHELARDWYLSLEQSAQSVDYQQSDVTMARVLAEDLSRHLVYKGPLGGNAMTAFLSGCTDLLASAGARRRAKLELSRGDGGQGDAKAGAVASLAARRGRGA